MRLVLFLISIFCLSQSGIWVRWSQAAPELLGLWRLVFASLFLAILNGKKSKLWEKWKHAPARARWSALAAGIIFYAHLLTFHYQAQHTHIANGMILFSANPLMTALISVLVFGERVHFRLLIAYALAIAGLYQLVHHQVEFEPNTLRGDIAALVSAGLYSLYLFASREARNAFDNRAFTLILFPVAATCFALTLWARDAAMVPATTTAWGAILGLTIFSTLLGHGLFVYLLRFMDINVMSCGKLLEPVLAALVAGPLFHEELSTSAILAFVLTASGVFVLFWKPPRKDPPDDPY